MPNTHRAQRAKTSSRSVQSSRAKVHLTLINYSMPDSGVLHSPPPQLPSIEDEEAEARSQAEALARRLDTTITTAAEVPIGTRSANDAELPSTSTSTEAAHVAVPEPTPVSQPTAHESGLLPPHPYEVKSAEIRTQLQAELDAVAHKWETLEMVVGLALLKKKMKPKEVSTRRRSRIVVHESHWLAMHVGIWTRLRCDSPNPSCS